MSDNEYEKFEITDYDLDNEFNINRPYKRPTKNQQIYGIWSRDDDSGDEDSRPAFKSGGKKPKNYTAPIGFVAGGVQQAGKKKEEEENEKDEDDEDSQFREQFNRGSSSSDDEGGRPTFMGGGNSGAGGSTFEQDQIAGLRKKRSFKPNPILAQKGVGTWEKHTKGIGAKLLLQMGYQPGKGLGKDLQGIQAPIQAEVRKGRGAIGAYGPEKSAKIAEITPEVKAKVKDGTEKLSQWRKSDSTMKGKTRYVYKSIEDVLDQSLQPGRKREFNELSKVKVIDMTGPEQRVLSGYHAISGVQRPSDHWEIRKEKQFSNFSMPELQHNLNLLVDLCEQEIIANDRRMRYNEDRVIALEAEVKNLEKVNNQEADTIDGLEHILNVIERLTDGSKHGTMTLEDVASSYRELQEKHSAEYFMYDMAALAPGIIRPLLKTKLSSWEPLSDPHGPISYFSKWKALLSTEQSPHTLTSATIQDPYHRILWDAWMPCVRIAIHAWTVKNSEPLLDFLQVWESLVPRWILENILQQMIMPRIQEAVEEWNPLTDTVPIHTWTQPWIPLLGKRLQTSVYPVIRQKLSSALTGWHPSDTSARLMLQPWVGVFTRQELDSFLVNNINPKLALVLQEFAINPHQQVLDGWNWVMDWNEMLPSHIMSDLLNKHFFPKWLQVLTMWLNMNPNYEQVTKWYSGWKALIPQNLREESAVKEQFRSALDVMSRSVGGPTSQPPPPPAPTIQPSDRFMQGLAESTRNPMVDGFKDLVQKRCEERGIMYMPLVNRFKDGKQVYRCGMAQVYIDRNVIFHSDNCGASWHPISLNILLQKASGMPT